MYFIGILSKRPTQSNVMKEKSDMDFAVEIHLYSDQVEFRGNVCWNYLGELTDWHFTQGFKSTLWWASSICDLP